MCFSLKQKYRKQNKNKENIFYIIKNLMCVIIDGK